MPKIVQSFDIDQTPEMVWRFFQNVPRVVTCMPGLEYGGAKAGDSGGETYHGKVRIRVGPVSAAFEGEATILATDGAARTARIEGKGIDKRGGSRASASVVYRILENGGGSTVQLEADFKLSGALAQMGRTGIVADVAAQIIEQFAQNLRATLAAEASAEETASMETSGDGDPSEAASTAPPPSAASEIRGERILLKILWRRIKALFDWRRK